MWKGSAYGVPFHLEDSWSAIDAIYEVGDPHPEEIRNIGLQNCSCNFHLEAQMLADVYHSNLLDYVREIQDSMKISK